MLPILTKSLGAYGYGLWAQAMATLTFAMPIIKFGLPFSMTRFFPGKEILTIREDFYSILIFNASTAGVVSLILFLFPYPLGNTIFEGEITIVRIVAVILFASCLERLFRTVFRAFREMKKYATINVIRRYGEVSLAIILVLLGYGVLGAIFALFIIRTLTSIILFFLIEKRLPYHTPNFSNLKEYLNFGVPAIPAMFAHTIVSISDRFIIGFLLGATFVGYYVPGYTIGLRFSSLITAGLGMVLLPTVSDYYENGNISKVKTILGLSVKYFLLLAIPYFVGAIIIGRPLLRILTTSEIATEGYPIMIMSAFTGILSGIFVIFRQVIFLKKQTKLIALFWGLAAAFNIIGNIFLIPRIGIEAAGMTTIISYFIVSGLTIHFSLKTIKVDFDYKNILKIVLSSSIMGLIVLSINKIIWSNVIFLITLGVIIYFFSLYVIGGLKKREINFLKRLYK